jgi:hypothetical protein
LSNLKWETLDVAVLITMADSNTAPLCNDCKYRVAEIFQVNGDYCLQCWQEKTYPDVQNKTKFYMVEWVKLS